MGLIDKLRGELIDIIEWLDDSRDTMVYRFGDFSSSWLNRGLTAAGAGVIAIAALPLSAAWLVLAVALGVGFRRRATLAKEIA